MKIKGPHCEKCNSRYTMKRVYVKSWLSPFSNSKPLPKPKQWKAIAWICDECLNIVVDKELLSLVDWRVQKRVLEKNQKVQP
jgi:hypothetical protein